MNCVLLIFDTQDNLDNITNLFLQTQTNSLTPLPIELSNLTFLSCRCQILSTGVNGEPTEKLHMICFERTHEHGDKTNCGLTPYTNSR